MYQTFRIYSLLGMKTSRVTLLPLIWSMIQLLTFYSIYLHTLEKREVRRNPWVFSVAWSFVPFWRPFRRDTSSTMIRSLDSPNKCTYPMDVGLIELEVLIVLHCILQYNSSRSLVDDCNMGDTERCEWFRCWIRIGWYVRSACHGFGQCVPR